MTDVSIRDLRNKGGEIVDRAQAGELITITRDGHPVARLTAIKVSLTTAQILERFKHVPRMDPDALRRDVDTLFDSSW